MGKDSLSVTFPRLYNISINHHITVHDALSCNLLSFRRALVSEKADHWVNLVDLCKNVSLNEEEDKLSWLLASSGEYSVKSFYSSMQIGEKVLTGFF